MDQARCRECQKRRVTGFGGVDQIATRLHGLCMKVPKLPSRKAVIGSRLARSRLADLFVEIRKGRGEHRLASLPVGGRQNRIAFSGTGKLSVQAGKHEDPHRRTPASRAVGNSFSATVAQDKGGLAGSNHRKACRLAPDLMFQ